ncbi:MAG: sulfotransferase, partial [Proteobacteria bacterium]|nr:sulfotransferase [Pseudomonadota bacterium]
YRSDGKQFPQALKLLRRLDWRGYGQAYLEEATGIRLTDRPIFTDKMPNNFPFVGLIHLILPNAKIINARRHPLDTCLGCYKQLFAKGQTFTYDLEDLVDYYSRYHMMMKHWHQVLPGKVLEVHLEETVDDLEAQVRRILEHCELPYEEACLRFHETERSVRTASSEQVRQPISEEGIGRWRHYEHHLDWVREALEPIIDDLPEVAGAV